MNHPVRLRRALRAICHCAVYRACQFALPVATLIGLQTAPLRADDFNFHPAAGPGVSRDWITSANWINADGANPAPPADNDNAYIGGGYIASLNTSTAISNLFLGYTFSAGAPQLATQGTLTIRSNGELDAGASIFIDSGSLLTINGGNLTANSNVGGSIEIGTNSAASTLNITNGAEVGVFRIDIDNNSTLLVDTGSDLTVQTDTINVSDGSTLTIRNGSALNALGEDLNLGDSGDGHLIVQSGSSVIAELFDVAGASTVLIDGEDSIVNAGTLFTTGPITIQNGGNLSTTLATISSGATVIINGALSSWNNGGLVSVGFTGNGAGNLAVQTGGQFSAASVVADFGSSISVTGAGAFGGASSLIVFGNMYIGFSTTGNTFSVQNGGYASDLNGFVGYLPGSSATATVGGAGSLWNNVAGIFINAGSTLSIQSGGEVDAGSASIVANATVSIAAGASMVVTGNLANASLLTLSGNLSAGSISGAGNITVNGSLTLSTNGSQSLTNALLGSGLFTKTGLGTLLVATPSPSFSGSVNINAGTLKLNANGDFNAAASLKTGPAGILDLNGFNLTASTLSGTGIIDNATASPASLTISGANSTFFGSINNSGGGPLALVRSGAGTLTLAGINSYNGLTTINAGAAIALNTPGALPPLANITNNGTLRVNADANAGTVNGSGTTIVAHGVTFTTDFTQASLVTDGTTIIDGISNIGSISGTGSVVFLGGGSATSDGLILPSLLVSGSLQIRPNGTSTGTSKTNSLTIDHTGGVYTGKLDLTNNKLILQSADSTSKATAIISLSSAITSGKNGGTWTGTGITSSTVALNNSGSNSHNQTLALVNAAELFSATNGVGTFGGQPTDSNSLLVTAALIGDADLNGTVDFNDLVTVAHHFNQTNLGWANGNFDLTDGSNIVDFNDLVAVAHHFNQTFPISPNPSQLPITNPQLPAPTPVPEPMCLSLFLLSTLLLLIRRPQHQRTR